MELLEEFLVPREPSTEQTERFRFHQERMVASLSQKDQPGSPWQRSMAKDQADASDLSLFGCEGQQRDERKALRMRRLATEARTPEFALLPDTWTEAVTPEGHTYYFLNWCWPDGSRTVQWHRPTVLQPSVPPGVSYSPPPWLTRGQGVRRLVDQADGGTDDEREQAAVTIGQLAANDAQRAAIARAGGIDVMIRLANSGKLTEPMQISRDLGDSLERATAAAEAAKAAAAAAAVAAGAAAPAVTVATHGVRTAGPLALVGVTAAVVAVSLATAAVARVRAMTMVLGIGGVAATMAGPRMRTGWTTPRPVRQKVRVRTTCGSMRASPRSPSMRVRRYGPGRTQVLAL